MSINRNRSRNIKLDKVVNLLIGGDVTKKSPENTFKFEIHTYFGDADAYETINLFIEDQNQAIEFADFLQNQLAVAYPNGRGGGNEYNYVNSPDVPDWNVWFGDGSEYDEELEEYVETDIIPVFECAWPCNWDYWGEATFDYAVITYFDGEGRELQVETVTE